MYGKHFASMYSGSMVGSGAAAFAVMGYVIANMKPDKTVGFQVELNVAIMAVIFGESPQIIQKAVDFLCAPDPNSRTDSEEGRRLVRVGQFAYRVVNGEVYDKLRNEEDRRKQNRIAQAVFRARKRGLPLAGETEYVAALKSGDEARANRILERHLPKSKA